MFTGIITAIGTVRSVRQLGDTRVRISSPYEPDSIDTGASIACDGACMTVRDKGTDEQKNHWFEVDVSAESISKTTIGQWKKGTRINLERALRASDELGGHIVFGHVDAVGEIVSVRSEGDSKRFVIEVPSALMRFIAPKGSITLNGTSLTVNDVDGNRFGVNIIAHTQNVTTWAERGAGDEINVEIDMLARYVARLVETSSN